MRFALPSEHPFLNSAPSSDIAPTRETHNACGVKQYVHPTIADEKLHNMPDPRAPAPRKQVGSFARRGLVVRGSLTGSGLVRASVVQ